MERGYCIFTNNTAYILSHIYIYIICKIYTVITFYPYMFASQKQTAQNISNYEKYIMMSPWKWDLVLRWEFVRLFFAGLDRWHGRHLEFSVGRNDLSNRHRISKLTAGT